MSLGDVRKFLSSLDSLPDEAPVKARVGWGKVLRELTVEDEDVGYRDFIASVSGDSDTDTKDKQEANGNSNHGATPSKRGGSRRGASD
jgi:hypothetical protein